MPLESLSTISFNILNRLLPYLDAQELTIQGRGDCHNHENRPSSMGVAAILTWNQVPANWPHHIFHGQLVPSGSVWQVGHNTLFWPFQATNHHLRPQAMSSHHWPPWPNSLS
ncbi:hypothetical protein O181_049023 [Austropuccinia psidii MF-1]|uniref:Uncharacterized protein n=1 Tax=Austropuccinia psidii MF-1 TaxID=1389203 RepID=A0A9Q3DZ30_9BASI|nr:hypothetical protein [Austropuccinia psidii MF-1]